MKKSIKRNELAYQGLYDLGVQLQTIALDYQSVIEENIKLRAELDKRDEMNYQYFNKSANEIDNILKTVANK